MNLLILVGGVVSMTLEQSSEFQGSKSGKQIEEKPVSYDLKNIIKEISQEANNSRTPIYIAILAAFLAFVSMADDDAGKRALVAHIEASNQFSYFQAKNIRLTSSEIAAGTFKAMGQPSLAGEWQQKADRYSAEKDEILARAKSEKAKQEVAIRQGDYFGIAIALLQIAIVLASVSLITGGGVLLSFSFVLSLLSLLVVVNGFGLYYDIPTDPKLAIDWVRSQIF